MSKREQRLLEVQYQNAIRARRIASMGMHPDTGLGAYVWTLRQSKYPWQEVCRALDVSEYRARRAMEDARAYMRGDTTPRALRAMGVQR